VLYVTLDNLIAKAYACLLASISWYFENAKRVLLSKC
jgi:hypothetical protein